jgi:rRNA maturation RNase YbeY
MAKILFYEPEVKCRLTNRKQLKVFIIELFEKEKTRLESMSVIFCTDAYLLNLNRNILQHDFYTDIISFDLSEEQNGSVSELYISVERVKENAILYKSRFVVELTRVIFHGCLHLCGYNDKGKSEIKQMREMENKYLNSYFSIK